MDKKIIRILGEDLSGKSKEEVADYIASVVADAIKDNDKPYRHHGYVKMNIICKQDSWENEFDIDTNDPAALLTVITDLILRVVDEYGYDFKDFIRVLKKTEKESRVISKG